METQLSLRSLLVNLEMPVCRLDFLYEQLVGFEVTIWRHNFLYALLENFKMTICRLDFLSVLTACRLWSDIMETQLSLHTTGEL